MIHTQRWTPDTCANPATGDACIIVETWDDAVPAVERVHSFQTYEKRCSYHAALDGLALYNGLYDQNRRKNTAFRLASSEKADLKYDQFSWSYDASLVLTVDFGSLLTAQQKARVQSLCDLQFGPGKVVVR